MSLRGRKRRHLLLTFVALQALMMIGLSFALVGAPAPSTIVIALGVCFVPYALTLSLAGDLTPEGARSIALVTLIPIGFAFACAPPVLSDDVYRFVWEGRVWLEGYNPYHLPPAAPELARFRDEAWAAINNKSLASIYPPISQALFIVIAFLGGGVWAVKLLALAIHVTTTIVVSKVCIDRRAPLALALNPLLLSEGALNGHLDLLTGLALLVVGWSLLRHRIVQAVIASCVAVGLKGVGLVTLPLFARRPIAFSSVAAVSAVVLSPLLISRPSTDAASGPVQFVARWRGNESLYALVEWVTGHVVEERAAVAVARAVVVVVVIAVGATLVAKRSPPLRATRIVLWTTLLLSPQVHPWYLAWLLPIDIVSGGFAGLAWSASVLCAYAPLDRWLSEGVWEMPIALHVFEYLVVTLAWVAEWRQSSKIAS